MSFADNLVYLRQHYGVTQEGLAEQLGVSRQTISKWEAGTNYPEMDKLLALCDLFHTNLDDLVRGSVSVVKEGDTDRYDAHMNRFNLGIALGVACILVGVGCVAILESFGQPDNVQTAGLLSFVVVSVVLLVMSALNHGEFKRRNPTIEPRYHANVLDRFSHRFPVIVALSIGLILLDVVFLVGFTPEDDSVMVGGAVLKNLITGPFMFVLAGAVGLLIWVVMQKSKYDLSELTYIGQRPQIDDQIPLTAVVKTPEQIRADQIIGTLCGIIMLLATIVFLVWGFVPLFDSMAGDGWDQSTIKDAVKGGQGGFAVSWIAFAVGGILCGVVALVGNVVFKSKDDWIAEARQENAWIKSIDDQGEKDIPTNGASAERSTLSDTVRDDTSTRPTPPPTTWK